MANSGDRNRDGIDDDFDRKPGGRAESRQYARTFDPLVEQEFSNLPELPNRIEINRILDQAEEQQRQAHIAERAAQSHVHFFPNVGKFIIPPENTWAAHIELVKDTPQNLYFNPEKFPYFDKIVAEKSGLPALNDPTSPDYAKYEGLRNNLAVMRNDIIGLFLDDGSFDAGDEKFIPNFVAIASALGTALSNDSWFKRPFTKSISVDVANVEGVGAREMYNYLLGIQINHTLLTNVRAAMGMPAYAFDLPPLEQTPYSAAGMIAPTPIHPVCFTPQELANAGIDTNSPPHERLANASTALAANAKRLRAPETLEPPVRDASIEEARTILRWLRNLRFTDKDMESWLDQGTPPEQVAKAEAVARLVEIHAGRLQQALPGNPQLALEYGVEDASDASGTIALALAEHGLRMLPANHPKRAELEHWIDTLPASADLRYAQPVDRLLDALESGLERVSGLTVGALSPSERLLELSNRIEDAARKLRSVDNMEQPARAESIELAREILRRLKNLSFSDQSLEEIVTTGRPEDKALFAQKIEEMVDVYKNLLQEAAEINPQILQDPRIKEANDAVGNFAHTIKLMAAKEIPGSVAAAQQISADITQMPEEWKALHDRTVGRLIKSMEGGLEQAVADLAVEQQQQAQDDDLAQEAIEAALITSDQRRRKRRRRTQRSGLGAGKQRKQHLELTADDYVLKQGRHAQEAKTPKIDSPIMPRLRPEDLATVQALGGSLRDIRQQAQNLPVGEAVTPDDKTLAQRQTEQRQNPGGSLKI